MFIIATVEDKGNSYASNNTYLDDSFKKSCL